jgi:NAD(P)-dependent dehydrogenase (short-subunit alcohol dehydrogenase family)
MNPTYDFTGHVALVTGASSGMGLATARAFAESGAAVVLADVNESTLRRDRHGPQPATRSSAFDATCPTPTAWRPWCGHHTFGRLDMAFNNAAGIQVPPSVPPTNRPRSSTGSTRSTCAGVGA